MRRLLVAMVASSLITLATSTSSSALLSIEPAAPSPTPSCKEWQTITQVPLRPQAPARPGVTPTTAVTPTGPTRAVCRNAPPTPFPHENWDPDSVVGGAALGSDGVVTDLAPGAPQPPAVRDVAYVVADLDSGEVIAAKAAHAWLRPASTLKTLTALTLIPRVDPDDTVIATDEHVAAEGTRVGMIAGNPYPVHSLLDAMLMLSANDAVYGLTETVGGYDAAVKLLNEEARRIGAFDTVAVDPSGLDEPGQHSSAYDLALIGRAAMQLPAFREHVVRRDAVFPGGKDATGKVYPSFHINNINDLLPHYPGAIGIKPGRTNRAQHTFIGAATREGRTLIVTQLGSTTGDWKETAALLDWGFANADRATPVGHLVEPGEAAPPHPAANATGAGGSTGAPTPATATPREAPAAAPIASGRLGEATALSVVTWAVTGLCVLVLGLAGLLIMRRRSRP